MALTLVLNGHTRGFPGLAQPARVEELVTELGLKGDRVAVELNGEIVARAVWAESLLNDGDRVEVVHFVGGGSPDEDETPRSMFLPQPFCAC